MKNRIETQYDHQTHQVHATYGTQIQMLFQSSSRIISEVIDEHAFSAMCDRLDDSGPQKLAAGAILLSRLARVRSVKAPGEEWNWSLTLVASTILRLAESSAPIEHLPMTLVALAYIAPVEIPDLGLPAAAEVLNKSSTSPEAWNAYEEIRTVENVVFGAVPTVSTAHNLWKELRNTSSNHPAFQSLLMRLEAASLLYRAALLALAKVNERNGS